MLYIFRVAYYLTTSKFLAGSNVLLLKIMLSWNLWTSDPSIWGLCLKWTFSEIEAFLWEIFNTMFLRYLQMCVEIATINTNLEFMGNSYEFRNIRFVFLLISHVGPLWKALLLLKVCSLPHPCWATHVAYFGRSFTLNSPYEILLGYHLTMLTATIQPWSRRSIIRGVGLKHVYLMSK